LVLEETAPVVCREKWVMAASTALAARTMEASFRDMSSLSLWV
jgi:hypothetical protein